MKIDIESLIDRYTWYIVGDECHRYQSWDNCYKAFSTPTQLEIHSLELAFYLASWEMYRGSSGLLQKTHSIHKGAVDIIFSNLNQKLRCDQNNDVSRKNIISILKLKHQLAKYYNNISFNKGILKARPISTTNTLLSKIMFGTLGCVPAYDRYFIDGPKEMKMKYVDFNEASLNELFDFIAMHDKAIDKAQK